MKKAEPPPTLGFKALLRAICSRRSEIRLISGITGSALCRVVHSTRTASADFCQPLPSLCNDGSSWQARRSPRVRRATFIPHTRCIYFYTFRVITGLWILWPPRPDVAASMQFLFVGPGLCLQLPSDSSSHWTPLLFG